MTSHATMTPSYMPLAGPSAPRQSARTARSSRKTRLSSGRTVLLGGGAGMLGSAVDGSSSGNSSPVTFPVHFASSPVTPTFPFGSTNSPNMYRSPSPLAVTQPPPRHMTHASTSSRKSSQPGSNSSLSSTGSSSSHALRTPNAKLASVYHSPMIAGGSRTPSLGSANSLDEPRQRRTSSRTETRSPTPTQKSVNKASLAQTPPKPSHPFASASPPSRQKLPPLRIVPLAEDWVKVNPSDEDLYKRAMSRPATRAGVTMIPLKNSPDRPIFTRAVSEPLSPTRGQRAQRQGRGSLDQLRDTGPTNARLPGSTPPALVLEQSSLPDSRTQHKALGLGLPSETERKSSTLSLKKSSGAIKALFNRGASGKKADTPPVPALPKSRDSPKSLGTPPMQSNAGHTPAEPDTGRRSLGVDRSLYPAPPKLQSRPPQFRQRLPIRELPELPPSSPIPPVSPRPDLPEKSPSTEQIKTGSEDSLKSIERGEKPKLSLLADALPSSSLPYLSPLRASVQLEDGIPSLPSTPPRVDSPAHISPILPSMKLDLLSLPKLDLDLDLTFDKFCATPTSRKASPQKRSSPGSPLPTRSLTTRASPRASPRVGRHAERPRSASLDNAVQSWFIREHDSPEFNQFFSPVSSSSAPLLSKKVDSWSETQSALTHAHTRTASNASSTDDTASPSSPKSPEDRATAFLPLPCPPTQKSAPPSIPLPAPPTLLPAAPISLAPAAVIHETVPKLNRPYLSSLVHRSKPISPDVEHTTSSLAKGVESSLQSFRSQLTTPVERTNILRTRLFPLLEETDKRTFATTDPALTVLQSHCFGWIDCLLLELRVEQAANDRGACLEGLGAVLESACLADSALSPEHRGRFTDAMVRCMTFVMGKLGAKGVFHNTLLFSGRFLAFAFFRIPHVGEQLVTVLQPPKGGIMRFTHSVVTKDELPANAQPHYPRHLDPLCFDDSRKYTARLNKLSPEFASEQERDAFLFTSGNWLRRWQSDDSELFPAFYRAYHRQLAIYLGPLIKHYETLDQPLPASVVLRAPGYAHLATIFAKKCHSYIMGSVNAVTTSSSSQSFEATETAGFRGSQKPVVLETANRRLVETLSTFANLRVTVPTSDGPIECDGRQLYSGMLGLWTKKLVAKTNLYAPKGVFCLFDLLDGIVDPPYNPITGERQLTESSLLDVPHLIQIIRLILTQGEHALTLVKVIAFVFTHWEVLTARHEDRKELCLGLLLENTLFERLLLFWSQSVRSYILRLVVFRLGHLHTRKGDGVAHDVEIETVRILQTRLDRIKRRYDELEPKSPSEPDQEKPAESGLPKSRSTITMVAESPRTGSANKAEKLLGLGFGTLEKNSDVEEGASKKGKAASWFKKSFGAKKKKSASPAAILHASPQPPFTAVDSPILPRENGSTTPIDLRKPRPPMITTSEASPVLAEPKSPSNVAFEFELPTMSPRSDAFDPAPTHPPASPRRNSEPPSPRQPQSPHMSRSFSKRSSLLPVPTAAVLASEMQTSIRQVVIEEEAGYDAKLHPYAIRMLAELEDAQKEYDEWWADGGIGRVDGAPPRLTVVWPFHEGDE